MGSRNRKVTVHGVHVDITEVQMRAFFTQYGKVEEVSGVISKAGIATGDIVIQVTLTRRSFNDIQYFNLPREENAGGGGRSPTLLLVMWGPGAHCEGVPLGKT